MLYSIYTFDLWCTDLILHIYFQFMKNPDLKITFQKCFLAIFFFSNIKKDVRNTYYRDLDQINTRVLYYYIITLDSVISKNSCVVD